MKDSERSLFIAKQPAPSRGRKTLARGLLPPVGRGEGRRWTWRGDGNSTAHAEGELLAGGMHKQPQVQPLMQGASSPSGDVLSCLLKALSSWRVAPISPLEGTTELAYGQLGCAGASNVPVPPVLLLPGALEELLWVLPSLLG